MRALTDEHRVEIDLKWFAVVDSDRAAFLHTIKGVL